MKKLILLMLICTTIGLMGCSSAPEDDSNTDIASSAETEVGLDEEVDGEPETEDGVVYTAPVFVYEDEMITVEYVGVDTEWPGLIFKVTNTSEQVFNFSVDSILVNGKTEQCFFSTEVLPDSYAEYLCDVPSLDGLNTLTANMSIYDADGYEIEEFYVSDIALE